MVGPLLFYLTGSSGSHTNTISHCCYCCPSVWPGWGSEKGWTFFSLPQPGILWRHPRAPTAQHRTNLQLAPWCLQKCFMYVIQISANKSCTIIPLAATILQLLLDVVRSVQKERLANIGLALVLRPSASLNVKQFDLEYNQQL